MKVRLFEADATRNLSFLCGTGCTGPEWATIAGCTTICVLPMETTALSWCHMRFVSMAN